MNRALFFVCMGGLLALGGTVLAQTATDENEGSRLSYDSVTDAFTFSWWGKPGRHYFIQQSTELTAGSWSYVPNIMTGQDAIEAWGFTTTGSRLFLRLKYSDASTLDPWNFDFDGDGVTAGQELTLGLDVFGGSIDANNDGIPDDWETLHIGEFAVYPAGFDLVLDWGSTPSEMIYLGNDTGGTVNYTISITGSNATGYEWQDSLTGNAVYTWNDIAATGTHLTTISNAESDSELIALSGFSFPFYGRSYSQLWVCNNGFVNLGQEYNDSINNNLPSTSAPPALIAAFHDDLDTRDGGEIYFAQDSSRLTLQFESVAKDDGSGTVTFQLVLHADGKIEFFYKDLQGDSDECTVGIQNMRRNQSLQLAYNDDYLQAAMAIVIEPTKPFVGVTPPAGAAPATTVQALSLAFDLENVVPGSYAASVELSHDDGVAVTPISIPLSVRVPLGKLIEPEDGYTLWEGEDLSDTSAYLRAQVTDAPDDIDRVEFRYADGLIDTDSYASGDQFSIDWPSVPPGEHDVFARVVLDDGTTSDSRPVRINVTPDADGDRMDDRWEDQYFNGIQELAFGDHDGDGASNLHEHEAGTDPADGSDTPVNLPTTITLTQPAEGQIFTQGQSVNFGASVSDGDFGVESVDFLDNGIVIGTDTSVYSSAYETISLSNSGARSLTARSIDKYGVQTTSAIVSITVLADTDGDEMPDDWEILHNLDPNDPADASEDAEGDGYLNLEEYQLGYDPNFAEDGDGDLIPDGLERTMIRRTPSGGWAYLDITEPDSDNNGIDDGDEDYDQDGLTILEELALGTDPDLKDTDNDGMHDGAEIALGNDPTVAQAWSTMDSDGDGLSDLFEILIGSDPNAQDSNNNGMNDKEEFDNGGTPGLPGAPVPPPAPPASDGTEPPADPAPMPPDPITPADYDILIETKSIAFPKYGHATFQTTDPPRRYSVLEASQQFAGSDGEVESGPLGIDGSKTVTIDKETGDVDLAGDDFVQVFGEPSSPIARSGSRTQNWYDDPENQKPDGTATINGVARLDDEKTTEEMRDNGKSQLEDFTGTFAAGTPFAYRNEHENELMFEYQKVQFKFAWKEGVTEEQKYPVTYLLLFRPEDDPDTEEVDESETQAEIIDTIEWDGQNEGQIFTIDPDDRKSGEDGRYSLMQVSLIPDAEMAGVIGDVIESYVLESTVKHFVTPKKHAELGQDYFIAAATGISAEQITPGHENQLFEWVGGEAVSGEPLKRRVPRDVTGETDLKIQVTGSGQVVEHMKVWVIWATCMPTVGTGEFDNSGNRLRYQIDTDLPTSYWKFHFTISPQSMFTNLERPNLSGAHTKPVPGAGKTYEPDPQLGDGDSATNKWDVSRQLKETIKNPQLISSTELGWPPQFLTNQPIAEQTLFGWPSGSAEGNDDPDFGEVTDEDVNPYQALTNQFLGHEIGEITSIDAPRSLWINNGAGGTGRTIANEIDFREFCRVELWDGKRSEGTFWFRISDYQEWNLGFRAIWDANNSEWIDNPSEPSSTGNGNINP